MTITACERRAYLHTKAGNAPLLSVYGRHATAVTLRRAGHDVAFNTSGAFVPGRRLPLSLQGPVETFSSAAGDKPDEFCLINAPRPALCKVLAGGLWDLLSYFPSWVQIAAIPGSEVTGNSAAT
ncbi:hypothetical protein P3T76_002050 [Phytophthora citrophthora]|uniref:Uncharacterized protein n=1 Tax=Phytophthora citrophthora TaxID=4793 RepID=A0AAD9GXF0_9STRA|nr:hypothetical protein P3T76_002050 [Phytophthora citrophthora]